VSAVGAAGVGTGGSTVTVVPGSATTGSSSRGAALLRGVRRLPMLALTGLVRFYQLAISPWTAPSCKYYPSCSQYALVALQRHGALRGTWLAVRRLGRCHPWAAGGVDDVPPAGQWRTPSASPARDGHHHTHHGPAAGHREQEPC